MFKRLVAAASCLLAVTSATTVDHVQPKIRRGEIVSRAVNLGGWLVSEYWMCYNSPLYKGLTPEQALKGEFNIMTVLGKEKGTKQFEDHWSTWITEKDIEEIAKAGLNTVRVSTGYWIINDEDDSDKSTVARTYAAGGLKYLDKLINEWAVTHNVAVMISLHAHKGSQNGNDHSAPAAPGVNWSKDPENAVSSYNYATFIAHRYKDSIAFLGLNLMNEPTFGIEYTGLWKYYKDAYKTIREDGNDCIIGTSPLLGEQGPPIMAEFMPCPDYYNVWHEFHVYYKWGWEGQSMDAVNAEAAKYGATHYTPWTGNPIFLGEWSLGTADEAARTDEELTKFGAIQMKEADKAPAGFAFWAWRHDDESKMTSGWSMRQLLKKKILTVPTSKKSLTINPKCPTLKEHHYNTSSGSTSGSTSGSSSGKPGSVSLYAPDKVQPANTDNVSTAAVATQAPKTSHATTPTTTTLSAVLVAATTAAVALVL